MATRPAFDADVLITQFENASAQGTAKLRPDMKLVINRAWVDPQSRLNGLYQLTKGLGGVARRYRKGQKAA